MEFNCHHLQHQRVIVTLLMILASQSRFQYLILIQFALHHLPALTLLLRSIQVLTYQSFIHPLYLRYLFQQVWQAEMELWSHFITEHSLLTSTILAPITMRLLKLTSSIHWSSLQQSLLLLLSLLEAAYHQQHSLALQIVSLWQLTQSSPSAILSLAHQAWQPCLAQQ